MVASEAAWGQQEFIGTKSVLTLNWQWRNLVGLRTGAYSPDRRDGMPVAIATRQQGILFAIETVDDQGFGSPSLVHRPLVNGTEALGTNFYQQTLESEYKQDWWCAVSAIVHRRNCVGSTHRRS